MIFANLSLFQWQALQASLQVRYALSFCFYVSSQRSLNQSLVQDGSLYCITSFQSSKRSEDSNTINEAPKSVNVCVSNHSVTDKQIQGRFESFPSANLISIDRCERLAQKFVSRELKAGILQKETQIHKEKKGSKVLFAGSEKQGSQIVPMIAHVDQRLRQEISKENNNSLIDHQLENITKQIDNWRHQKKFNYPLGQNRPQSVNSAILGRPQRLKKTIQRSGLITTFLSHERLTPNKFEFADDSLKSNQLARQQQYRPMSSNLLFYSKQTSQRLRKCYSIANKSVGLLNDRILLEELRKNCNSKAKSQTQSQIYSNCNSRERFIGREKEKVFGRQLRNNQSQQYSKESEGNSNNSKGLWGLKTNQPWPLMRDRQSVERQKHNKPRKRKEPSSKILGKTGFRSSEKENNAVRLGNDSSHLLGPWDDW